MTMRSVVTQMYTAVGMSTDRINVTADVPGYTYCIITYLLLVNISAKNNFKDILNQQVKFGAK